MITLPASDDEKLRQILKLETGQFSEEELEIALIVVPDLFDPAPFFCGRQLPVESGVLDLFGLVGKRPFRYGFHVDPDVVWGDSFPTVYELKARKIRREHIAQVLDYALAISEMSAEDMTWHLVRYSGGDGTGIGRIWDPKGLKKLIQDAWGHYKFTSRVVVGTGYDASVVRLAEHAEVELYTVSELCRGWRERRSGQPNLLD
ncbi:MAG: hypothetical protein OXL37_13290 [Chloroflexota bacterium]|nr:hypothetical protein [Chloroflexota bacterium]MDE2959231.1 hypothetical protein [Chloroflexota bacterium]